MHTYNIEIFFFCFFQCPSHKLDSEGKPDTNVTVDFVDEAKYFTECRLLQQDVEIVLESSNNNNFVGTVIHPVSISNKSRKQGGINSVDLKCS